MKKSKRTRENLSMLKDVETVSVAEAVNLLKKFKPVKFDQSVEVAMRLGIDAKQTDQNVRGSIVLPHGIGKTLRVCVITKGDKVGEAQAENVDFVGDTDIVDKIKGGWTDFDVCIATPDMMGLVGPLGKILGPRGLMPSPRAGTVTMDVAKTIREYKAGKVEFKNCKTGNVHAIAGKLSFDNAKLVENIETFINYVISLKPTAVKGQFIKGISISTTMSPGVRVAI